MPMTQAKSDAMDRFSANKRIFAAMALYDNDHFTVIFGSALRANDSKPTYDRESWRNNFLTLLRQELDRPACPEELQTPEMWEFFVSVIDDLLPIRP